MSSVIINLKNPIEGIDVSGHQDIINWEKVKESGKVKFVLIRIGYGNSIAYPNQVDKQFERNYSECKRLGIPVGAYYYSYATTVEMAKLEAESCLKLIENKQFEYPIFYDVEERRIFDTGKTNEIIKAFCSILEAKNWWVGIYIYRSGAQTYLTSSTRNRYAMAVAEYSPNLNYKDPYGIWQNSSTSRIPGIKTDVDHDWCYVDYPTMIKNSGRNGFKPVNKFPFRIETIAKTPMLSGTPYAPPVKNAVGAGNKYNISAIETIDGVEYGKIEGDTFRWVKMSDVKKI